MKKIVLTAVIVMALSASAQAYTSQQRTKWEGMWDSVGGFIHNLAPWNWENLWKSKNAQQEHETRSWAFRPYTGTE